MKLKALVLTFGIIMAMSCTVFAESTVEDVESAVEVVEEIADDATTEEVESAVEAVVEDAVAEEVVTDAVDSAEESVTEEVTDEVTDEDADEAKEEKAPRPQVNALDYIVLGDYKGLEVEVPKIEITDEQIDNEIEYDLEYFDGAFEQVKEGEVKDGDTVNIDYVGKIDGKEFDGGSGEDFDLEIGSGSFIDGFEEQLVGHKVGDVVEVNTKFPEDYFEDSVAGKDAVFTVTINYIKEKKELDDALVSELTEGACKTVEEYREQKAKELREMAEEDNAYDAKIRLIDMAMENSEMKEYPQELVDYYKDEATAYYQDYADKMGVEYEEFLKEQEIDIDEIAEATVKNDFVIDAIAETEGLIPSEEELPDAFQAIADEYGFDSVDSLTSEYSDEDIIYNIKYERVIDFLYDNAKLIEVMEDVMESDDGVVLSDEDFDAEVQVEDDGTEAGEEAAEEPGNDGPVELVGDTSSVSSSEETTSEATSETTSETTSDVMSAVG